MSLIKKRPGIRMSNLWRAADADRGTAKYHLLLLERAHEIEAVRESRTTRFFPPKMAPQQRAVVALLRHGRVMEVAQAVTDEPGILQRDLTKQLPMSRKVFRRYANMLIATQLLREERQEQERRYYPTPELAAALNAFEQPGPQAPPEATPR